MWPFKQKVKVEYVPAQPRYQALGTIDGQLYFINAERGRIFRISRNHFDDMHTITEVVQIVDR